MSTGWRLIFGIGLAAVGIYWIFRREVPVGIEGRPPSFHARGIWAVGLGILAIIWGLVVAFDVPRQFEIDSCLDSGGRFDYERGTCESPRSSSDGMQ
jgi:hypothetical protein